MAEIVTAFATGIMAACAIAALVALMMSRQERRCSANVHEIGTRLSRLEAHTGLVPPTTHLGQSCPKDEQGRAILGG